MPPILYWRLCLVGVVNRYEQLFMCEFSERLLSTNCNCRRSETPSLFCPLCSSPPFVNFRKLLRHIRITHADESNFNIQCSLQGCRRTFTSFNTYKIHVSTFHNTFFVDNTVTEESSESSVFVSTFVEDEPEDSNDEDAEQREDTLQGLLCLSISLSIHLSILISIYL